jgi:hypothetical protein
MLTFVSQDMLWNSFDNRLSYATRITICIPFYHQIIFYSKKETGHYTKIEQNSK